MVSPTPGLVAQMTGRLTTKRYKYATVFIDHFSDLGYVHFQQSASAEATLEAKVAFERHAQEQGVVIRHYHADNGVFASKDWRASCFLKGQGLSFAGVNAHHQNGKAERRIRELQQTARTMLIHAQRRWPSAITANLWPYTVRMANEMLNATPSLKLKDGRSPESVFSASQVSPNPRFWHHFGCPVYVLDEPLQKAGGIHHKWTERSKVGIYLGRSPQHAQSVALVLSLTTGLVSPQFHLTFDPSFQTIKKSFDGQSPKSLWQEKAGFTDIGVPKKLQKQGFKAKTPSRAPVSTASEGDESPMDASSLPLLPVMDPLRETEQTSEPDQSEPDQVSEPGAPSLPEIPVPLPAEREAILQPNAPRRSKRRTSPVKRLIQAMMAPVAFIAGSEAIPGEIFCLQAMFPEDTSLQMEDPIKAFAATSNPDVLYFHEAMKAPDKAEFLNAMNDEVEAHLKSGVYSPILRSKVPEGATILPAVWSMKRKRRVMSQQVYKWKSRLNIGGHKMIEGRDYDQTYSPTASWPSIRLLLSLSLIHGWETRSLDYVQAYPQAPVERPMYMQIPQGFQVGEASDSSSYLLEIHKNIYGQKQAGRVWNQYLVEKLLTIGFKQSEHDDCIFYKGNAMYVLYTDDSILAGPDPKELDQIMDEIKTTGLKITSEEGIDDFLGVHIDKKDDGSFELTQPHLITSILEDLGLNKENVAIKSTPAATSKLLSRHPSSPVFDEHFHYRRVIGKMNYLEKCTRPDIAYAVHQCARFSTDPRFEHGQAVKWLGRYLYGTRDKGMILKPSGDLLEVYVDSDFAGNWDPEIADTDSSTARSRSAFVLNYCGCPIAWASKLQTEIALSSTESEYCSLSSALRVVIPIMNILQEMKLLGFDIKSTTPRIHCRVFEDNAGALEMAKVHKQRPRTKHMNVKLHHFRSYVNSGAISIHKVPTLDNQSDCLTKSLPLPLFRKHRKAILGWDVGGERECKNNEDDVDGDVKHTHPT